MGCLSELGEKPIWRWAPAAPLRANARTGDEDERSRREMMDVWPRGVVVFIMKLVVELLLVGVVVIVIFVPNP